MTEGAADLLHGENLVDGSERREQKELLPWLVAKGCAEEHHRIDEAVARFFWLNAGFVITPMTLSFYATIPEITGG